MKKFLLGGMVATLAFVMPGLASAQGYSDDWGGGPGPGGKRMHRMMEGVHWMTGTVESVDQKTGWLKVKTADGTLNLHFPPDSLKDVKAGDTVTVHMGFHKGAPPKAGTMMEEKKDGKMMMEEKKKEEKPMETKPAM